MNNPFRLLAQLLKFTSKKWFHSEFQKFIVLSYHRLVCIIHSLLSLYHTQTNNVVIPYN
jgi:hypothetical protein